MSGGVGTPERGRQGGQYSAHNVSGANHVNDYKRRAHSFVDITPAISGCAPGSSRRQLPAGRRAGEWPRGEAAGLCHGASVRRRAARPTLWPPPGERTVVGLAA